MNRTLCKLLSSSNIRHLNKRYNFSLQEFQCKNLMSDHNINVQRFKVVTNISDIGSLKSNFKVDQYVVKAQIPAGGRGLGVFDNGFKGGVHLTNNPNEMEYFVCKMLGHRLRTKQTSKNGILVNSVMVAEALDIKRETYFAILLSRECGSAILVACKDGGVDIEDVANQNPDAILKERIDPDLGITDSQCERVAIKLGFDSSTKQFSEACAQMKYLYKMFLALDCIQVEINPFGETTNGEVVCFDAKLDFDPNAFYRQPEIVKMISETQALALKDASSYSTANPLLLELTASRNGLNYVSLADGNIGCIVNGAGLSMATLDILNIYGGKAANFLDLGGSASEETVEKAFQILKRDPRIQCVLVNIFGGIINCRTISNGILAAVKKHNFSIPIVVRLEGNNGALARSELENSDFNFIISENLDDAAILAIQCSNQKDQVFN